MQVWQWYSPVSTWNRQPRTDMRTFFSRSEKPEPTNTITNTSKSLRVCVFVCLFLNPSPSWGKRKKQIIYFVALQSLFSFKCIRRKGKCFKKQTRRFLLKIRFYLDFLLLYSVSFALRYSAKGKELCKYPLYPSICSFSFNTPKFTVA